MTKWFADRMILRPTRHRLLCDHKERLEVPFQGYSIEVFRERFHDERSPQLFVLKLGGNASRAESAGPHPFDAWDDLAGEIWAVNPPGYGRSGGHASLTNLAPAMRAVCEALIEEAAGVPIIVTGNSIGTASALHLACRYPQIIGCALRNPPPLRQLINGQFGRWSLGLAHLLVARFVPPELDSIAQAAQVKVPAVFILSQKDTIVPPEYQRLVVDAYAGPKREVVLPQADHGTPLDEREQQQYFEQLRWLREVILPL